MAEETRPEGLETKDTRGTLLGYIPAEVPHVSRTAHELSDAERSDTWKPVGTPHAGEFNGEVSTLSVGDKSDSEHARRVGEGHYPAEAPAAPSARKAAAPKNEQPESATPKRPAKS